MALLLSPQNRSPCHWAEDSTQALWPQAKERTRAQPLKAAGHWRGGCDSDKSDTRHQGGGWPGAQGPQGGGGRVRGQCHWSIRQAAGSSRPCHSNTPHRADRHGNSQPQVLYSSQVKNPVTKGKKTGQGVCVGPRADTQAELSVQRQDSEASGLHREPPQPPSTPKAHGVPLSLSLDKRAALSSACVAQFFETPGTGTPTAPTTGSRDGRGGPHSLVLTGVDELHEDQLLHVLVEDVLQRAAPLLPQPRPELLPREPRHDHPVQALLRLGTSWRQWVRAATGKSRSSCEPGPHQQAQQCTASLGFGVLGQWCSRTLDPSPHRTSQPGRCRVTQASTAQGPVRLPSTPAGAP